MNGQMDLRIITQPYSEVYWGYFRRLVFGNSSTKHIKLSSFSYSVVIFFLPIYHIPPCFHTNPPDDMHMALFRVRDGFISAQVSEIFHEPLIHLSHDLTNFGKRSNIDYHDLYNPD